MPTQTSDVLVDGTEIPLGPTLRGRAAREALPQLRRQPGLQHLGCIEPAGILSISFGLHPPRIAETLPASAAGDDRRRRISVKLPAADAWVQGEVAQTAALLLDLLARRGAMGISSADWMAIYRAVGGALDRTRRITDLRAHGCAISTVVFRNGGDRRAITRLHSHVLVETAPGDGLPIVPVESIVARAYVDAAVQQAGAAHDRYRHHLVGLVERGRRWRLGAELQARLAAAGLMGAEGRP